MPFGANPLNLAHLVWLTVASAWHTTRKFVEAPGLGLKLLRDATACRAPAWPGREEQWILLARSRRRLTSRSSNRT